MPPENPDGTRHKCDGTGVAKPTQKAAAPKEAKITTLSTPPKTAAETQDIQAEYVQKEQTHVFLKDCVGEEQSFRADLEVIKMLSKADSPVQPGKKYRFRLIKQRVVRDNGYADEWVISRVGTFEESFGEKPFKTGKEILQENLESKQAETEKADAALAQINKDEVEKERLANIAKGDAEGAARAKEHQEYIKELTEGQKPMTTSKSTTTPEKSPQNEAVTVIEPLQPIPAKKCYSDDEMMLLRNVVAKGCNEPEFKLLMYMANTYGLDPLLKQIWAVKLNENSPALIFAGRDGMLAIAHRSGQFDGMQSGVIYEKRVVDAGKPNERMIDIPMTAWCEVWRKDMSHSFKTEVPFAEYNTGVSAWKSNPSAMILKVAESVCLRKAFSVSGLYSPEEISDK